MTQDCLLGNWVLSSHFIRPCFGLKLYNAHTYTGKGEGYFDRSQDNWLRVGEWDRCCSPIMILDRRKAWPFSVENAGLFTLTESGIKVLDTVSKHNARKNVNTRCWGTTACLFYFHILSQGMVISTWHFNFRCFYNSVRWIWILSVHVYALVGDHDRMTVARVIQQKYCILPSNTPRFTSISTVTFYNKVGLLQK